MTADTYFANWESYNCEEDPFVNIEYESDVELEATVLEDFELKNFYYSPKLYFEKNGDSSPELIQSFLNSDLIHTDSTMFKVLYIKLLRHTCLAREKHIPLQAVSKVIGCNGYMPDSEVVDFMLDEGLMDLTDEMFDMLVFRCNKIK